MRMSGALPPPLPYICIMEWSLSTGHFYIYSLYIFIYLFAICKMEDVLYMFEILGSCSSDGVHIGFLGHKLCVDL
jgi:hypothetical protein